MSFLSRSTIRLSANTFRSARAAAQTSTFSRAFSISPVKMGVHNVATKPDFEAAIKENKVVVVDAFATWCGPCKVIAPQVVKFSDEFPNAHFVKLDVDEVPDVAEELGIRAMPTFLVFKNGEKVSEVVGANPKALYAAIQDATKADD